jgi:hypothetical protein
MKTNKNQKFFKYEINNLNEVIEAPEIIKIIIAMENLIENAIIFKSLVYPQPDIAKRYFQDAYNLYTYVIKPTFDEMDKKSEIYKNIQEKIEKLEEQIKDLDLNLDL